MESISKAPAPKAPVAQLVALWIFFVLTLLPASAFLSDSVSKVSVISVLVFIGTATLLARLLTQSDPDSKRLTSFSALIAMALVVLLAYSFHLLTNRGEKLASAVFIIAVVIGSQYPYRGASAQKRFLRVGLIFAGLAVAWILINLMVWGPTILFGGGSGL